MPGQFALRDLLRNPPKNLHEFWDSGDLKARAAARNVNEHPMPAPKPVLDIPKAGPNLTRLGVAGTGVAGLGLMGAKAGEPAPAATTAPVASPTGAPAPAQPHGLSGTQIAGIGAGVAGIGGAALLLHHILSKPKHNP
jgi:hypothetical protein